MPAAIANLRTRESLSATEVAKAFQKHINEAIKNGDFEVSVYCDNFPNDIIDQVIKALEKHGYEIFDDRYQDCCVGVNWKNI